MAENNEQEGTTQESSMSPNEKKRMDLIGPGIGLIILGLAYLVWYVLPFSTSYLAGEPREYLNWGYAMTILITGCAWYHKSVLSRIILMVEAILLPIAASGSVNTFIISMINWAVAGLWLIIMLIERSRHFHFFETKMQKHTIQWLNMHLLIITWILIAHIAFVFLTSRAPQEANLLALSPTAGWLTNIIPQNCDFSTWAFDIALIGLVGIMLAEQVIMGYNPKNKLWPRWSFWWVFVCVGAGLIALVIQIPFGFGSCTY